MADTNENQVIKLTTPKFMITLDDMGLKSTVKGFEDYAEVLEWGQDAFCHASPHSSGSYSQKEPPTVTPIYMRMVLGIHMPKLIKVMVNKKSIVKGSLVSLANIDNSNVALLDITLHTITVEEVRLGNNLHGKSNKNLRHVDNNHDDSFEMLLRCALIEWKYNAYKAAGGKEGADVASLNIMTGEAK